MKKRIFIMMAGLPASGKTTTRKDIVHYLKEHYYIHTFIINRDELMESRKQSKAYKQNPCTYTELKDYAKRASFLQLSYWLNASSAWPVCIWDNTSLDVFTRKEVLEKLSDEDTIICAVHMNRDTAFCKKHNDDPGHVPEPLKSMISMSRRIQQPIFKEGFHVIHHVDGNHRLSVERFIDKINTFPNSVLKKDVSSDS